MKLFYTEIKELNAPFNLDFLPNLLLINIEGTLMPLKKRCIELVHRYDKNYLSFSSPVGNKRILFPLAIRKHTLSTKEVLMLLQGKSIEIERNIFTFEPLAKYEKQKRAETGALRWELTPEMEDRYADYLAFRDEY